MDLQEVFYVLGIIVMSVSLIILIVIVAAVVAIRTKINHIHRAVEEKLNFANTAANVAKKVIKKR
jgi:predicted Holliday junction resolvase-like endonuclease